MADLGKGTLAAVDAVVDTTIKPQLAVLPLVADTYFTGMPLVYSTTPDQYEYSATVPTAIYLGPDDTAADAGDTAICLMVGQVHEAGIVDDAGDALTLTDDIIQSLATAGVTVTLTPA